jgi:putative ABC transport system permease protein
VSLLGAKLRRDLRASWSRFVLMVVALAVGLTVVGGVLMAWAATDREVGDAYVSTGPASATIVLDTPVDADRMAAIATAAGDRPQVIEATGRTQFDTPVEVNGAARTIPLQVFVAAPDDPMRMVRFDLRQPGSWPPATGEIYLGTDSTLPLLGAAVGDTLTVAPPGGDPVRLRVAGTVYDPSLAPSPQEQRGHGYLSTASLTQPALLDQLKIQVADPGRTEPSRNRDTVVAVAGEVATWLRRDHGLTVTEIQVPRPDAHPHQWQFDVLLLSLLAGGAAALLLAAILVATMLNTLFTRQIPQIGIMKAIGARSVHIGRWYLAMIVLVAAAATLLALGPAVWLAREAVTRFAGILGIQPESQAPPGWTYLVTVAVGLALPPLIALFPLVKASRTTVRAAIDHHGAVARPSAATGVLARLSRARRLDRGLLMALRNAVRRPARFWLSVGLLAGAGMVFVAGMSLRAGTQAREDARTAQRYWDVEVELAGPAAPDAVTDAVRAVSGVARVEAWTRAHIGIAGPGQLPVTSTYPDQGHGSMSVDTVPADPIAVSPTLAEGRWLDPGETGAVVLNQQTRNRAVPALGPGDTVQLFIDGQPSTWRIAGIVAGGDSAGGGAYTTAAGFAAATGQPQQVNRVRLTTDRHDERTRQTVASTVDSALRAAGIEVAFASSVSRTEAASAGHAGPVLLVLLGVALPLGVLGAIGLATTMSANILDRTREFGVLHAIGARPRAVRGIVVAEGVILALASCLIAILPTLALTRILGIGLGNLFGNEALPFRISGLGAGTWLVIAILGAILATDAAATRASRLTVREALAYL